MRPFEKHVAAIKSGTVDKAVIRGLTMALNAHERAARGYSNGTTAPKITADEREYLLDDLLPEYRPRVVGPWHDSGMKLLRNPRYRKQLASMADIIAELDHFRLVGFDYDGPYGLQARPVYRAYNTTGKSLPFVVIPWQSNGSGPQIMSSNYW